MPSRAPPRAADRLRHHDVLLDAGAQRGRGLLDRLVGLSCLFADDPLEHGAAQQLLRDGALPFLGVERLHAAQQLGRQRRIGDADLRLRLVLAGQEQRERRADDDAQRPAGR